MVRREFLSGPAHAIDEPRLTSVQMGDPLWAFYGGVYCFALDFLNRNVQTDIDLTCCSLGDPRFLVQDTSAQG
jgi:hypothetical protein